MSTVPKLPEERIESMKSDAIDHDIEIAITKLLIDVGFHQKRIASLFDCSQGRVAEISIGKNGPRIGYEFRDEGGVDAGR